MTSTVSPTLPVSRAIERCAREQARSWFLAAAGACVLLLAAGSAAAQDDPRRFLVPPALVSVQDGAVTFAVAGSQVSFLPGIGWTTAWGLPGPEVAEAGVVVTEEVAALLRLPRIVEVRTGIGDAGVRLVVDMADLPRPAWEPGGALERREGPVGPDRPLLWRLPHVAVPVGSEADGLFARDGLRLDVRQDDEATTLALAAPDAVLTAFPLRGPDRLVLDLAPSSAEGPVAVASEDPTSLGRGARYRRLRAMGRDGPTIVHLIELDPQSVELRVVGRSGEGRTVAAWAEGGLAAINAGYFDPSTFTAIGLRRIGGTLLSWPSRNRAVIGFGPSGTTVVRAGARVQVDVDGLRVADLRLDGDPDLAWSSVAGSRVGSARVGVLLLSEDGTVRSNTVGPRTVPPGGSALAYPADVRPLALVEPGQRVTVGARLLPDELERSTWAVEAGPLLVQDGAPAFAPELESFTRGARILDEATQQAAVAVRADGTVLFLVAERMIAEDLVPLLLRLDADAGLRLDSGSSATLVADGRTVNRLLSRPVESAIVAVPRDDAAGRR